MKVSQMVDIGKIAFVEKPIPTPNANEILVKLEYVGICGSDLHYYSKGRIGNTCVEFPFTLGHEPSGTVVSIGRDVKGFSIGDRVALEPGKTCGHCRYCREGLYNLCPNVVFFATPPVQGIFQEYVAHEAKLCFKLPENVSTLEGALIEPLAVGFQAMEQANAQPGMRAIVAGAGSIGLVSMMALHANGLREITVTDVLKNRLEKAKELGASSIIFANSQEAERQLHDVTNGEGFDLGIETTGTEEATRQLIASVRKGATIVLVGYPENGEMRLPISELLDKEITVRTVFRYRNQFPKAIQAVSKGDVNLKGIVTRIFELEDLQEAMDASVKDKAFIVKSVVHIG